jgi:hypothetical protein
MRTVKYITKSLFPYVHTRKMLLSTFHSTSRLLDDSKKINQPFVNKMFGNKPPPEEDEDDEDDIPTTNNNGSSTNNRQPQQKQQSSKHAQLTKGPPLVKKTFELDEKDLEEKFVIGSGPGIFFSFLT